VKPSTGNCDPRQPAQYLQTRNKESKNYQRWYYTCQKPRSEQCDFFLWKDAAEGREKTALIHNSRTEPTTRARDPTQNGQVDPNAYKFQNLSSPAQRRVANGVPLTAEDKADEDIPFEWDVSQEEAANLLSTADATPQTPRKSAKKSVNDSPSKRPHSPQNTGQAVPRAYPTPATDRTVRQSGIGGPEYDDLFAKPTARKLFEESTARRNENGLQVSSSTKAATTTPYKPNAEREALISPSSTRTLSAPPTPSTTTKAATSTTPEMVEEVFALLTSHSISLSPSVKTELESVLNRYHLRSRGIERGRDVSRQAVKDREVKILDLQGRIEALEGEREMQRTVIRGLRAGPGERSRTDRE
jgi:GRF zinc finger